jgi:hypothetical protein
LLLISTLNSVADKKENTEDETEPSIFASDLIKLLEESILTFRLFLKKEKKRIVQVLMVRLEVQFNKFSPLLIRYV